MGCLISRRLTLLLLASLADGLRFSGGVLDRRAVSSQRRCLAATPPPRAAVADGKYDKKVQRQPDLFSFACAAPRSPVNMCLPLTDLTLGASKRVSLCAYALFANRHSV